MAEVDEESPLVKALPPATDYLTYLTLIEYNLTTDNLPVLHKVLQDTTLTVNIGWDLVHLLMPLLPASNECLQDIARLGNPREVILKATESLRLIDFEGLEPDSDDDDEALASEETQPPRNPSKTAPVGAHGEGDAEGTQAVEVAAPPPLPVLQFTSLLSMLAVLHPRIKTQYPSRFISTTLQAILAAFSNAVSHKEDMLSAIAKFVNSISGAKRPSLPSRKSSSQMTPMSTEASAPDPEAEAEAVTSHPSVAEAAMQSRLLQSFITHLIEDYMIALSSDADTPGLAWSIMAQEKLHPERNIPGRVTMTERFNNDEDLKARLTVIGELVALARDLGIQGKDLRAALKNDEMSFTAGGEGRSGEDAPPASAADIPLSKTGSLFLGTAMQMQSVLYAAPKPQDKFYIFPDHQEVLTTFVSGSTDLGATIGTEPEAVLDAILALGLVAIANDQIGEPADNEQFSHYLQFLSLIASNCPSPSLRSHAFYLATTVLRSNPSDVERLAFIKDTLEHCPFENLRDAAISWIKGETIEANPQPATTGLFAGNPIFAQQHAHTDADANDNPHTAPSVFATPVALDTLAPFLFPDLTPTLTTPSLLDAYASLQQNLHFYFSVLNFYSLLLSAPHLHESLAIKALHENHAVETSFLRPLKESRKRFEEEAREGGKLFRDWDGEREGEVVQMRRAELGLLEHLLEVVEMRVKGLK